MRTIPIQREAAGRAPAGAAPLAPARGTQLTLLPPLALYIHVPWCVRKCPYCDFNSHEAPTALPEAEYLAALAADLEQALPLIWGRKIVSVFVGGGTPSLLSAHAVDSMLALVRSYLPLLPEAEITLEANPGASEAERFAAYAQSGVNRISLGVQSFDDACLRALGRIHDAKAAVSAVEAAQRAVSRVNLDLMTALPGQTTDSLARDVRLALGMGTEHLSLYQLTLEPNTVFAKYPPQGLPDDDTAAAMHDTVVETAAAAGLEHYEVSAWARPGARCRHNVNYWEFGDYLGIGPGAHSKISFPDRIVRQARVRSPQTWLAQAGRRDGSHLAEDRVIPPDELPFEFMLNALRLREGIATAEFTARTGVSLAAISPALAAASAKGLLDPDPGRIMPTPLGWRFLNDLQAMFL
ncbi:oxygen-independent coproporphyrinogen III oxidase-like protein [Achromobacter sp. GG226]|uniref:radical SAM family heme chaperone HemW n=1 Tax=Verticiella alkaliphila TaxID=2779529 RepID=UPI001C0B8D67|nr:radical SAM family heme chaperone HemW [Verticiella sp. GG226]MBU4610152.1 oxygen-independent coproporphyrinogen III oxidase-like protein [Verticiella sp. GG226]